MQKNEKKYFENFKKKNDFHEEKKNFIFPVIIVEK